MIGARTMRFTLVAATAALVLSACGSSSKHSAGLTIGTSNVPGVGNVLVNAKDGKTLYLLTSEQGGKLTCTDDNGCTKVWPDTELPSGVSSGIAGNGVNSSLLSTVKTSDGHLYVTYNGWPLYTYSGDSGPMQSHGQGIQSFGGTWYALDASGNPVKTAVNNNGGY
jgi:predicted lipoprotein with Yx(FWY)xxD motif